MSGKFVSVSGQTVTLEGSPNTTHDVTTNATIKRDGKTAKLADLKAGDDVELSGDPATSVTATSA